MRDIPGYEGLYAVTEDGHVWSHPKTTPVGSNGGESCAAIARRLSLNPKTVWDIVHRKRWVHVD